MATGENRAAHPGAEPLSQDQLKAAINNHAPVVYFHPDESYFPSSIEWFLDRALLVDSASGAVILRHPTPAQLPTAAPDDPTDEAMWLTFDPDVAGPALEPHQAPDDDPRRGDPDHACAYVRAVHHPDLGATDLQYWMFYPYDGPGLARIRPIELGALRADHVVSLWPGGMHEADWELAVVRIDHATLEPSAFFGSQHKGGDAHLGGEAMARLEREASGQIRMFSSLYGHASYAHAEERALFHFSRLFAGIGIELGIVDQTRAGRRWDLAQAGHHRLISTSWNDPAVPEPGWLDYPWRWGARDPAGGRFTRRLIDALKALFEGRMATTVLLLHLLTLGLSAIAFAFAAVILGGKIGTRMLGSAADNSGPVGPKWQQHKWNGEYGFTPPPSPVAWRAEGHPIARHTASLVNLICSVPLRAISLLLGLIALPFLPKT